MVALRVDLSISPNLREQNNIRYVINLEGLIKLAKQLFYEEKITGRIIIRILYNQIE